MIAQLSPEYVRVGARKTFVRLASYALFEGRPVTTRGRWINPLVFFNLRLWQRLPPRNLEPPVFIVGQGRSGTTILGLLLSAHPRLAFLNEPKALWHLAHGSEDVIGNYRAVAKGVSYRLDARAATPDVTSRMRRMVSGYLRIVGYPQLLDKSPEALFRLGFLRAVFPEARFVALVRRGWDCAQSIGEWCARHGRYVYSERHDWWGVQDRKWRLLVDEVAGSDRDFGGRIEDLLEVKDDRLRAAVEWTLMAREILRERDRDDVCVVHFEELVAEPARTLNSILAHARLRPCEAVATLARRLVRPIEARPRFEAPGWIFEPFMQTMNMLGYDGGA